MLYLARYITLLLAFGSFSLCAQEQDISALKRQLDAEYDLSAKVSIHLQLAKANLHRNAENSLLHLGQARILGDEVKEDSVYFNIYSAYVNYHFIRQDYKKVTVYIDSTSLYKESASPQSRINILSRLAQSSFFLNDFGKSIEAYQLSLEISEEHKLLSSKVGILNQISSVYRKHGDFENAEKYVREALQLNANRGLGDIMYSKVLLGKIKAEQGNTREALQIFEEVYAYTKEHRDPVLLHSVNSYMAELYFDERLFDKALQHSEENLKINNQINNTIGILGSNSQIASIFTKQGKYDSAIARIKAFIPEAERVNSLSYLQLGYEMLSENYEYKGDHLKALKFRKLYEKWNDSLLNSEHLDAVSELKIKYETEKTQNELLALSQQNLQDEVALEKQRAKIRWLSLILIGGSLLFAGLFVIFRQHFRNKKQQELLIAITDTQTKEGMRIAKDLHDSVGASLALTKNKLEHVFDSNEDKQKEIAPFLEILSKTGEQIREISHNMMPGELLKFGLIPAVQSLLEQAINGNFDTQLYHHGFTRRLSPAQELSIYRICQEALQNALKHADAQLFTVNLNRHDSHISLIIEDDGKGFLLNGSVPSGMGLQSMENRVALLQGKMKISSVLGKGTTFDIKLPIG